KRKELAYAQTAFRSSRKILDFSSRFSTKCRKETIKQAIATIEVKINTNKQQEKQKENTHSQRAKQCCVKA
ncbi:MAG: hypothetical protein IKY99_07135, partial [Bacteroidaceae bacterium]|nr:hypothetical protein [Bacteroidaceae bacterium]